MPSSDEPQPKKQKRWSKVIVESSIVVKGGLLSPQKYPGGIGVNVETYETREGPVDFVSLERNSLWFLKVSGGEDALKGHFKNTKIFDIITEASAADEGSAESDPTPTTPTKLSAVAEGDAVDPMSKLKIRTDTPVKGQRRGPKPKGPPATQKVIVHRHSTRLPQKVNVPKTCTDEEYTHTITIKKNVVNSRVKTLLSKDDLPWLMEYIASECNGGIIPDEGAMDEEEEEVDEPDPTAPPFQCVWSPNGSWQAVVTRGKLKGMRCQTFLNQLDDSKWTAGIKRLGISIPFKGSVRRDQKRVSLAYLEGVLEQKIKAVEGDGEQAKEH